MQGAEMEDEGSVLKYMTKSEIEEQRCSLLIMTQRILSCVRVNKMQGAEMEDEGSVLKYMTKSEIEEQRSSLLIMTQRLTLRSPYPKFIPHPTPISQRNKNFYYATTSLRA